jgi:hypothetical protein
MDAQKPNYALVAAFVLLLLLTGCRPGERVWVVAPARAWLDANENGTWDDDERPLPSVRFPYVDQRGYWIEAVSKEWDEATVGGWGWRAGGGIKASVTLDANADPDPNATAAVEYRISGGTGIGVLSHVRLQPGSRPGIS